MVTSIRRKAAVLLAVLMFAAQIMTVGAADKDRLDAVIADTAAYLVQTTPAPQVGSIGGEWVILGLARSGEAVPQGYFENYVKAVEQYVTACGGVLSKVKYTEYSRLILALTALGCDPTDVTGYNLLLPLGDYEATVRQGIGGAIWALLALDCAAYELPVNDAAATQATEERYLQYILEHALPGGGWAVGISALADPDITGMALAALAPYREREDVRAVLEAAVAYLSKVQTPSGGFVGSGAENAESAVQVLVGLCALEILPDDSRFVKNGNSLLDNILHFACDGGGFAHTSGGMPDAMATEQCFYGLVAARRAYRGDSSLFCIADRAPSGGSAAESLETAPGLPGKHADIACPPILASGKTFADIDGHPAQSAVEALAARSILNGKTETAFEPDAAVTRAEFAAITVRSLGLPKVAEQPFADILPGDWFYDSVGAAFAYGVVNGVSETAFDPMGTLTREQAAVMVARAASLCGLPNTVTPRAARDILAAFTDYVTVSDWAAASVAFCYENGLWDDSALEIRPGEPANRAEIAEMLYRLLERTELL